MSLSHQEKKTVWLTQKQISLLFGVTIPNIIHHMRQIYAEKELDEKSVCKYYLITGGDGKAYEVAHYNLQMILSIGYRVNGARGITFRKWASSILTRYLNNYIEYCVCDKKHKILNNHCWRH